MQTTVTHKAVFLSRDHALVARNGPVPRPDELRLMPGAPEAVRRLREAGFRILVLSNEPGLLEQEAGDHSLDLSSCWVVGASDDEVSAGRTAGCRTVLLGSPDTAGRDHGAPSDYVSRTFAEAVDIILSGRTSADPAPAPGYAPDSALPGNDDVPSDYEESAQLAVLVEKVEAILELLRQQRRATMQRDFSATKLLGAVCQMIALGLLLWAWMAMMENRLDIALTRVLSMIAVQLITLTLFVLHQHD